MKKYSILFLLLLSFVLTSCNESITDNLIANSPPNTFLFLRPDSTISEQQSKLTIHWWGDDKDGLIKGFNISFKQDEWTFTTRNDSTIAFPIEGIDTTYLFKVAAVDDNNLVDPTPAELNFPLKNSSPVLSFLKDKSNQTIPLPETTFTVASVGWTASDIDGDETIIKTYIALNDTSFKIEIPGNTRFLTLKAAAPFSGDIVNAQLFLGSSVTAPFHTLLPNFKLNSNNTIYIWSEDIAGATSNLIRLPEEGAVKNWYVQKPVGDILIIDDYSTADISASFYASIFDSLGLTSKVNIYNIGLGKTASTTGLLMPKYLNPMFIETMKLFKYIFWYTDNNPSMEAMQTSVRSYLSANSGNRILISLQLPQFPELDPLRDFLPVDSLGAAISILPKGTAVNSKLSGYPSLVVDQNSVPVARVRTFYISGLSTELYSLGVTNNPLTGFKNLENNLVFIGLPLHRLNGGIGNVREFFEKVFIDEFGVSR